jgi:predicted phage baseplate assembly protein
MGLPLPTLDNRTYAELVREGLRVVPRQAPRWTDHNAHDPGITLLELFAYLVEMDIFRLDRTPEAALRAFLRLVGIEPAPPRVAETVLELRPSSGAGPIAVAAGLRVSDAQGAQVFETDAALHVVDARLVALANEAGGRRIDRGADNAAAVQYPPLGQDPAVGDALLLGFDAPLGAGGEPIALHVWTADPEGDAATRARLIEEWRRAREAAASCGSGTGGIVPDWRQHYSARTLWEYLGPAGWSPLSGVEDDTRALSLSGFVRFPAPTGAVPGGLGPGLWTLRCRLAAGGYECPPAIRRVGFNAVRAVHGACTLQAEHLGISNGRADQAFDLASRPAVAGSLELEVSLDDVEDGPWREVPHWDRIGPHDCAFVLDPARARIVFGDGRIGRVPPTGARIAGRYRVGGGSEGNLEAGTLVQAEDAAVSVRQPFAAFGGAPAETLDEARGRALDFMSERFRAVTLADVEALALATPGVPVARARAIAGYHPAFPCVTAAGSVTLVAVPSCPGERPEAGPDFVSAVHSWLAPRCPVTTELHVVGPVFRTVVVEARLHADPGTELDGLIAAAAAVLDRFLHPLSGGPDGTGWPPGRAVYRTEVMAVLNGLPGVAYVDEVSLHAEGDSQASCADLVLCPAELATAGAHRIRAIPRRLVR